MSNGFYNKNSFPRASKVTLTTILIHIVEVITVLLIAGKLFQVRRLYRHSSTPHVKPIQDNEKPRRRVKRPVCNNTLETLSKRSHNFTFSKLPEPEVSFSLSHEQTVVQNNIGQVARKESSAHKVILNNYIDDFFSDAYSNDTHNDSLPEDDFITVAQENAEMVRVIELSNKGISLAHQQS